jgi:hypothetical protein
MTGSDHHVIYNAKIMLFYCNYGNKWHKIKFFQNDNHFTSNFRFAISECGFRISECCDVLVKRMERMEGLKRIFFDFSRIPSTGTKKIRFNPLICPIRFPIQSQHFEIRNPPSEIELFSIHKRLKTNR